MHVAFAPYPHRSSRAVSSSRQDAKTPTRSTGLLRRLFTRKTPTLYQRCLAVHIASAAQHGALR